MSLDEKPSKNYSETTGQDGYLFHWYRVSVDLFKAVIWPIAVLFIFFSIKAPVLSMLAELPAVIKSMQKMTIGSVSIERRLRDAGIPADVRRALAKLSRQALILLLDTGRLSFGYLEADWETKDQKASAIQELQKQGLLIVRKTAPGEEYPFKYSLTPAADKAYEIVLTSVVAQLAEDSAPAAK